ncbi:MAG: tetratricopeptide repeat protein [Planctomycetaceae bacterium]|nr:tetratricopeptide repeat protein [Planctomycetaceae bacterium]
MRSCFFVSFSMLLVLGCASQNQTAEGIRYYGQARYDTAMTAFQEALKANPNDPNALYNVAATYHLSARVALKAGQAATAQQQYELAAQHYQLALAQNANLTDAYRGLAALYLDCQNGEAAYQLLSNWQSANPVATEPKIELARYYHEFAQICQAQGRLEEALNCRNAAERLLQQVLATEPANHIALRALGYLKEQSGDIPGAVFEYHRSLQANPQQKDLESRIAVLTK